MKVVGVDGCSGGWIAMCWDVEHGTITPGIHGSLAGLIAHYSDARAIGVDIPIGLSDNDTRTCDVEARRILRRGRASSVFPPPIRDIPHIATYGEAVSTPRAKIGKGVSQQSVGRFWKDC